MQNSELYQAMFYRMSVRRYDPTPLSNAQLEELKAFWAEIPPLVPDCPVHLAILASGQVSRSITAPHFAVAYAGTDRIAQTSAGYYLQHLALYLAAHDIGCCYNGMAKPHPTCESLGEIPFAVPMAFGTPAASSRRTGPGAFKRKDVEKIARPSVPRFAAEAARVAPSAINAQPWLLWGNNHEIDLLYTPRSMRAKMVEGTAFLDAGIALAHICIAARQQQVPFQVDFDADSPPQMHRKDSFVCKILLGPSEKHQAE